MEVLQAVQLAQAAEEQVELEVVLQEQVQQILEVVQAVNLLEMVNLEVVV
jgi:hypothetical protein